MEMFKPVDDEYVREQEEMNIRDELANLRRMDEQTALEESLVEQIRRLDRDNKIMAATISRQKGKIRGYKETIRRQRDELKEIGIDSRRGNKRYRNKNHQGRR
jgi:hypothetical protein